MKIGIIGKPQSGKSTLFDVLTRGIGERQQGRFQARRGTAMVPDARLDELAKIYQPNKVVAAQVSYTEVPTPVKESDLFSGESLGLIQKMDALLLVARAFEDPNIPHLEGTVDHLRDIRGLLFDMQFQDIALLEKRVQRIKAENKAAAGGARAMVNKQVEALETIQKRLEDGIPVNKQDLNESELTAVGDTFLVSSLPIIIAVNIGEEGISSTKEIEFELSEALDNSQIGGIAICVSLENELLEIGDDNIDEMRLAMNAGDDGLQRVINLSYSVLGLISFFTVGKDEVRAWTIKENTDAVGAARAIHSDIARGFIRAELVAYDDFIAVGGSMVEAKNKGVLRSEGRTYIMQDGDIVNFLFST